MMRPETAPGRVLNAARAAEAVIAPAGWRDFLGVWRLERACFNADAWGPAEILFALLSPSVRLKAHVAGRLVGFVLGEPYPADGLGWIATLGVHPDFQRRGLGARLLQAAENHLGATHIKLTVREGNLAARCLYERAGYRQTSRVDQYYSDGECGLVMEKQFSW